MKASFSYAVRYEIAAVCESPLRTGNQDGDTDSVLRGYDGRYRLQGSSLAGAMRDWASAHFDEETVESIFGSQAVRGSLRISDGIFSENTQLAVRPRIRIDGKTGSASQGGFFSLAHLEKGSEFHFTITWLGHPDRQRETEIIERILGAMHLGEILLGAQKSNGFGRVSLLVKKQRYDLYNAEDRDGWLKNSFHGDVLKLPDEDGAELVTFVLTGTTDNLLVKASSAEHTAGSSYTPNMTANGMPIIPGSSAKGTIRARVGMIAAYLGLPVSAVEELFGRGADGTDNGLAGKVRVEETYIPEANPRKITRIRINRFTGSVIRGGLFTEEPVSGPIGLKITCPAKEKAGCMLLLYALRDLGLGLYNLGSGGSIGRGIIRVSDLRADAPGGRSISLSFKDHAVESVTDPTALIDEWRNALEVIQ